MSDNPFSGPFGGGLFDEKALENPDDAGVIKCPACKKTNFHAWTHQYGITRKCLECKNEWSGGTFSVGRPDFSDPIPPPGMDAGLDLPVSQYTGAAFRDPSKNTDGE